MDDIRTRLGEEATDRWPELAPELLLRNWRNLPPVLTRPGVLLREVEPNDAVSLFALLSRDAIAQVVTPPPQSVRDLDLAVGDDVVAVVQSTGVMLAKP